MWLTDDEMSLMRPGGGMWGAGEPRCTNTRMTSRAWRRKADQHRDSDHRETHGGPCCTSWAEDVLYSTAISAVSIVSDNTLSGISLVSTPKLS